MKSSFKAAKLFIQKKIGNEEMTHITDFKNAKKDKLDTIDFNTDSSWELMLFPVFSRTSLRYFGRNKETKTYIVTVIRRVCKTKYGKFLFIFINHNIQIK